MPFSIAAAPVTPLLARGWAGSAHVLGVARAHSGQRWEQVPSRRSTPSPSITGRLGVSPLQAPVSRGRAAWTLIHVCAAVTGYPFRLI